MTQSFSPAWLPAALRRPVVGYGAAILVPLIAVAYTFALMMALPGFMYSGLLSVLGVVVVALVFGPGPSLLATLLGALLLNVVVTPPYFRFSLQTPTAILSFLLYVVVGVAISVIAGQVERGRRVAQRLAAQVAAQASQKLSLQHDRFAQERAATRARVEALEASQRQMDEFLNLASHELRTPLTVAMASVQIVRRQAHSAVRLLTDLDARSPDAPTDGERLTDVGRQRAVVREKLAAITTLLDRSDVAMARLNRLVGDLLDVSRIEAGRFQLSAETGDLVVVMREAIADQRRLWPDREILVNLPTEELLIRGDQQRLMQIAIIFLSNALKFAPPTRPVRLRLQRLTLDDAPLDGAAPVASGAATIAATASRASRNAAFARLVVMDEGPGLSVAQQAHVWDRFTRVRGIQQQQGSGIGIGLGLYIAQAIVAQHGGRLGVESALGVGAAFWCELPLMTAFTHDENGAITPEAARA